MYWLFVNLQKAFEIVVGKVLWCILGNDIKEMCKDVKTGVK